MSNLFFVFTLSFIHSLQHSLFVFLTELCPDDYNLQLLTYLLLLLLIILFFVFFFCLTWRYYYYLLFYFLFLFTIIIITENIHTTHTRSPALSFCGYPLMTSYQPLTTNPCFSPTTNHAPLVFVVDSFNPRAFSPRHFSVCLV